jgi:bifunctional non-homologous end joining protein LigD
MRSTGREFDVDGRRSPIRQLDQVVFPGTGTTTADLLGYYTAVAPIMLPHLRDRLSHMHRHPEQMDDAAIDSCVVDEPDALLRVVNIGTIELHASLHPRSDLHRPTVMAFQLDPGESAGMLHCAEVALRLRQALDNLGLASFPKTSGSSGLQVYVPLNNEISYSVTKPLSHRIAELLEAQSPGLVASRMARAVRAGKVLVDWSQNTRHKSMVCVYSVRAQQRPTVATPVEWSEVREAVESGQPGHLSFEMTDVLKRIEQRGDLFAPVLTMRQQLPAQALST